MNTTRRSFHFGLGMTGLYGLDSANSMDAQTSGQV